MNCHVYPRIGKDRGGARVGGQVIVTGWRAGEMKCGKGSNCGKVSDKSGGNKN